MSANKKTEGGSRVLGRKVTNGRMTWVQTQREAHEEWSILVRKHQTAASLLHLLIARMESQNAVVIQQKLLAELLEVSDRTIRNALTVLKNGNWLEVVKLHGPGSVCAYVINSRVAWGQERKLMHKLSTFNATVIADSSVQDLKSLNNNDLRKITTIFPSRLQTNKLNNETPE